jgi:hypothetical protein
MSDFFRLRKHTSKLWRALILGKKMRSDFYCIFYEFASVQLFNVMENFAIRVIWHSDMKSSCIFYRASLESFNGLVDYLLKAFITPKTQHNFLNLSLTSKFNLN